jgi:Trp operon repressor
MIDQEDDMQQVYNRVLTMLSDIVVENDPLVVAAVMMTQAMSIYKTALTPDEYESMITRIYQSRSMVQKFKTESLH